MSFVSGSNMVTTSKQFNPVLQNGVGDLETLINDTENHIWFATVEGFRTAQLAMETDLNRNKWL